MPSVFWALSEHPESIRLKFTNKNADLYLDVLNYF